MADLVDQLVRRQQELGETDKTFAAGLGVSRPLWRATRTRELIPQWFICRGVLRRFPELEPLVVAHLRSAPDPRRGARLVGVA